MQNWSKLVKSFLTGKRKQFSIFFSFFLCVKNLAAVNISLLWKGFTWSHERKLFRLERLTVTALVPDLSKQYLNGSKNFHLHQKPISQWTLMAEWAYWVHEHLYCFACFLYFLLYTWWLKILTKHEYAL